MIKAFDDGGYGKSKRGFDADKYSGVGTTNYEGYGSTTSGGYKADATYGGYGTDAARQRSTTEKQSKAVGGWGDLDKAMK